MSVHIEQYDAVHIPQLDCPLRPPVFWPDGHGTQVPPFPAVTFTVPGGHAVHDGKVPEYPALHTETESTQQTV